MTRLTNLLRKPTKFFSNIKKLEALSKLWLVFIFLFGLVLTLAVPPTQKPDEYVHFDRTVSVANGYWLCSDKNSVWKMQKAYSAVNPLAGKYQLEFNYGHKFDYKELIQPIFRTPEESQVVDANFGVICGLPPVGYLPQAVILTIANLLNLNGVYSYYLGRLGVFLFFYLVLLFIITSVHKNYRYLFLTFASIPVVLHQIGSYSYDSFQIMTGLLIFYELSNLLSKSKIKPKELATFIGLLVLFYLTKPQGFWPFFALPLLLLDVFTKHRDKLLRWSLTASYLLVVLFAFAYAQLHSGSLSSASSNVISPMILQRKVISDNPWIIPEMIITTTKESGSFYFNSFFSTLGWLDYDLGLSVSLIFTALIFYTLSKFQLPYRDKHPLLKALLCFLVILASYLLVITGMYLSHTTNTEIGGKMSVGTQGRYLLLLLPVFYLMVGYIKQSKWAKLIVFALIFIFISFKIINGIFLRYYDYQKMYELNDETVSGEVATHTINQRVSYDFEVDPQRKLKGFTLVPAFYKDQAKSDDEDKNHKINMPYYYSLSSGKCENDADKIVAKDVIPSTSDVNGLLSMIFERRAIVSDETKYCLTIKPAMNASEQTKNYDYIKTSAEVEVRPIYIAR